MIQIQVCAQSLQSSSSWLQRWPAWHQKLPPGIGLGNLAKSWPGVSTSLSIGWTGHMESTIGIEADCGHNGNLDMKKVLRDDVGQIRSTDDQSTKWYRFPSGYYLGGVTSKSSDWSENQMVSILVSVGYVTDNQGRENAEHIIPPTVGGFASKGSKENSQSCFVGQTYLPALENKLCCRCYVYFPSKSKRTLLFFWKTNSYAAWDLSFLLLE